MCSRTNVRVADTLGDERTRPAGSRDTGRQAPAARGAPRERLLALLADALERRLASVVAEAGYGKSTLLADWAGGLHCAWYSASGDDASLAAFARGLADAVRLRVPGLPADVTHAVTTAAGPGAETDELSRARGFAAVVCETLQAQLRRDLVLVIDDVHEVTRSVGAMQLIEALCRQAPPRLHVTRSRHRLGPVAAREAAALADRIAHATDRDPRPA